MSSRCNAIKRLFWRSLILFFGLGLACGTAPFLFGQTLFSQSDSASSLVASNATRVFHPGLMRIDISITATQPTNWIGEITLSRGAFTNIVPLGCNATSGSDFFFSDSSQNSLTLFTRSPETFCGVETTVIAPRDSQLELKLLDATHNRQYTKTVFIERLIDSSTSITLDDRGTVVEITRAPADELPVCVCKFGDNNLFGSNSIFRPNETLSLTVIPRSSSSKITNDLTLVATARIPGSETPFWSDSRETPLSQIQQNDLASIDPNGKFTPCVFNMTTPDRGGVFEITFELFSKTPNTTSRISLPLPQPRKPRQEGTLVARRVVQGVVVPNAPNQREKIGSSKDVDGNLRSELLVTIDPTNPSWRKAFSKRRSLPFYKSTSGVVPSSEKIGNVFRSTFADNENNPQETFANDDSDEKSDSLAKFRQIAPVDALPESRSNAPSSGLVLGQTPSLDSHGSKPFNMNIFGLGKSDQGKENVELTEARERYDFVSRWERDEFNSFLRNLDRRHWNDVNDLWEKPISSGSSRLFTADELKQFAPPRANFTRLEPNGSTNDQINKNNAVEKLESLGVRYSPVSWEAYPVPIQTPGVPHLLEIEYPTSFPQKLAISILEQGISGALLSTSQNAGIIVEDNPLSDRASREVSRFSMVFWPKTKTPVILLSNASSQTPAAYGQIRIYRAKDAEPRVSKSNRGRIFSLAFTSPDICRQFSAALKPSFFGLSGAEDWQAFDDSISRLLHYLSAYNYDAAMLAVAADGSSLYPSQLLNPTPKYDKGVFLSTGGDQNRKDVLTLAVERFETQGKSLIPLVKLNGTLPNLEYRLLQLRSGLVADDERNALEGVEWIGVDSRRLIDSRRANDGSGPYYNVLHPEVEKQVLAIVQELVARCAPYDSFGGLALDVGANGWLALPDDVYYGMDDVTIARFVRESDLMNILADKTNCNVQDLLQAKGPERYRKRAEFINSFCRNEWLEWRVDALFNFYNKIYATIASARSDLRLFLVASNALDGPNCQKTLFPKLGGGSRLRDSLRLVGLDPTRYATLETQKASAGGVSQIGFVANSSSKESWNASIVLLHPEKVAQTKPFVRSALDLELKTPEALSLFSKGYAFPGAFFLHETEIKRLYDFDLESPFPASVVELNTRALPAGFENRRRFARSLAIADCLCFFDGGDAIPFGQEEALRDWISAFKSLPAVPFKTWRPKSESSGKLPQDGKEQTASEESAETSEKIIQPIVARYYQNNRETWIYLLNAAPFHTNVKLTISRKNKSRYEVFAGLRQGEPIAVSDSIVWSFIATPYDLVALRVDDPKATIESIDVTRPAEICGDDGRMRQTVRGLVDRIVAARKGLRLPIRNGGFEESFAPAVPKEEEEKTPDKANFLDLVTPQSLLFKKNRELDNSDVNGAIGSTALPNSPEIPDMTRVPGWRVFGPNDVDARLDSNVFKDGRASLKLSSRQSAGGIVSQPFAAPTSGRLCIQISLGVKSDARELPLEVCLTGRKNGVPYVRRLAIGEAFLKKIQKQKIRQVDSGVVWHTDVILFDQLPLDGLEGLSLCFELVGRGEVWLDQIQLYRLAFATTEQTELMKFMNMVEYRASKGRVVDVMFMLDNYWSALLRDQLPDDSQELAATRSKMALATEITQDTSNDNADSEDKTEPKDNKGWSRLKFW